MIVEFACEVCGKHVRKRRSPANTPRPPRFCSQRCHGEAKRGSGNGRAVNIEYDCAQCGQHVAAYRSPSAIAEVTPKYCSIACTGAAQRGENNPSYTGGRHVGGEGYVYVLMPAHPLADTRGYVLEHRLVMESVLGRFLTSEEVVHHENEIKTDNNPSNLRLFANQSEHMRYHAMLRSQAA